MTFERGRRLRAKQFMTFSVTSVKHKKDKKLFLHVDLTHYFTKAIKHVFIPLLLFVVQSSIQLQQKETETNSYLHFQQSTCLTFLSWHAQPDLIPTEICIIKVKKMFEISWFYWIHLMISEKMMACLWKLQLRFWTYSLIHLLGPSGPNVVSGS